MSEYETDIMLWSSRQAELLRPGEEIESVGNEHRFAVESLLINRRRLTDVQPWRVVLAGFLAGAFTAGGLLGLLVVILK